VKADRVLVVDAGTSALRAVLVAPDGATQIVVSEPWRMFTPEDAAPFGREFDAAEVCAALGRLLDAASSRRDQIAGVAFTGQREGLVFVDETGKALLVSPNIDARASAEGMAIDAKHAEAVYRATGHLPSLMQVPAKFAWLRERRPRTAERVRHAVPLADWLASTLTGTAVASRSLAAENGMLDITGGAPPEEVWSMLGVPSSLVPPVVIDGSAGGECSVAPFAGTPVVLCGGDTQCALVGMGAVTVGSAGVSAGWSAPVQLVTASPVFDAEMRTWTATHVVPQRYVVESNAGETGRVWEWLLSMLALSAPDADALAAASPAGANDVMISLGAPRMNAAAMNAGVGGITFPLPIVMAAPDRADLVRAMLESIAFAVRANLEQAEQVAGVRVAELRLGGGMSRSPLFASILAAVIGRPVVVASTPETSALGAAALAAAAFGIHDAFDGAMDAMVRPSRTIEPDARASAEYEDVYQRWFVMSEQFVSMP
jgi:autoinducer 2 (AI-2) kinase